MVDSPVIHAKAQLNISWGSMNGSGKLLKVAIGSPCSGEGQPIKTAVARWIIPTPSRVVREDEWKPRQIISRSRASSFVWHLVEVTWGSMCLGRWGSPDGPGDWTATTGPRVTSSRATWGQLLTRGVLFASRLDGPKPNWDGSAVFGYEKWNFKVLLK